MPQFYFCLSYGKRHRDVARDRKHKRGSLDHRIIRHKKSIVSTHAGFDSGNQEPIATEQTNTTRCWHFRLSTLVARKDRNISIAWYRPPLRYGHLGNKNQAGVGWWWWGGGGGIGGDTSRGITSTAVSGGVRRCKCPCWQQQRRDVCTRLCPIKAWVSCAFRWG